MKDSFARKVNWGFGGAIFALLVIGAAAWWSAARYKGTAYWIAHTHQVMNELERLRTDVLSMQSNVRGFVLTGDEHLLQPYTIGNARIDDTLQRLRDLVADNAHQQARLRELEPVVTEARELMRGRIATRRARGLDVAGEAPFFLRGQQVVANIDRIVTAMMTEEQRLLEDRFARMNSVGRLTVVAIAFAVLFAMLTLLIAARMLRREASRRAQMESAVRQSEERLRLMVASVSDYAIVQLDPAGRVTSWNNGAVRIKGYATEEIVGESFARFYPEEVRQAQFPERLLATATRDGRVEDQGWRVRKDGSRFWADVVITAVRDHDHTLLGFVKLTRDLTTQRAAQERIESLNEDLRQRAVALESANHELEAFSYSVSHDLRAPLRHIDGFAGLLGQHAGDKLDATGKRYLEIIAGAARQMGALIDDLLAFSRIGRAPLHITSVDQAKLVREVIAEGRYDQPERPISWEIGELPAASADAALLRQVWRNLLDNAVKYSGKTAAPRIDVGGRFDATTGENIYFVADNGVGFEMEHVDKLFGVFQRLHGPTEFEGTGIGLANVRRIVTRHRGRTWAEGKVNAGATFYFSLPAVNGSSSS